MRRKVRPHELLDDGRLDPTKIINLMGELGFKEATNLFEYPITPGSDFIDMYLWRERDRTLVSILYCTGEVTGRSGWDLRFKRRYERGDEPEYKDVKIFRGPTSHLKIARAIAKMINKLIEVS